MKLIASRGIAVHVAVDQPEGVSAENWLPITYERLGIDVIMRVYDARSGNYEDLESSESRRIE